MNRRTLLKQSAAAAVLTGIPSALQIFISSCNTPGGPKRIHFLSTEQFMVLEKICDIMIPETATPGATATRAAYFTELALKDCVPAAIQEQVKKELDQMNGKKFLHLPRAEQESVVKTIDADAFKENSSQQWFRVIKKLACIGHFTNEKTAYTALEYRDAWGAYQPCINYKKGNKAMAKNFLLYY